MKYSNLYLLYPVNKVLERAIGDSLTLLSEQDATAALPDTRVTVADNFRHTRGNYEQQRYSTRILEPLCAALEASLGAAPRAETLNALGNVLAALGQQRRDAPMFEQAIRYFQQALTHYSPEDSPQEWAATQYNLGTALQALGRLHETTAPFKLAVDAYTCALQIWSREAYAEAWMRTMHQLGLTLHSYGIQLKGNRQLQKSVVAYKNALAVLDADNYALELTATHNNRGVVLHHLGESEQNPDRLKEAINAYEKGVTVSMEQQLPIHIAVLCRVNRATAQGTLARLTSDSLLAEEVADEFEVIMECFSHALQPLCLKHCHEQKELAQLNARVSPLAG